MNPFVLYPPTTPVRDPDRPWWIPMTPSGWVRASDGAMIIPTHARPWGWHVQAPSGIDETIQAASLSGHVTEHVDALWPAPRPPILVGQVWAMMDGTGEIQVLASARGEEGVAGVAVLPGEDGIPVLTVLDAAAFDVLILVRGDHAPWAPPGWTFTPPPIEGS